jgi:hypothetical protein
VVLWMIAALWNLAKAQEFAACRTFHLADPPLEPQGGRLHNLLRTARMNRELHLKLAQNQIRS